MAQTRLKEALLVFPPAAFGVVCGAEQQSRMLVMNAAGSSNAAVLGNEFQGVECIGGDVTARF